MRPVTLSAAAAVAAAAGLLLASPAGAAATCVAGSACWPAASAWATLNASVGGRLFAVHPAAQPCFEDPGGAECADVLAGFSDTVWRASKPGAMQYLAWEANATTGASCFNPGAGTCDTSALPALGVAATSVADVQATLAWASARGVRTVVKCSGHELQGASWRRVRSRRGRACVLGHGAPQPLLLRFQT